MSPRSGSRDAWQAVCRVADLEVDRGVAALVHGQSIAIFRVHADGEAPRPELAPPVPAEDEAAADLGEEVRVEPEGTVYALGNHDPFARSQMIARGIVGVRDGVPFVASPTHKHTFDLRTGRCLDDGHVSVPVYCVKVIDGMVMVGARKDVAA